MPKAYSKKCPHCQLLFQDRKSLYNHKVSTHIVEVAEDRVDRNKKLEEKRVRQEQEMAAKAKDALMQDKIQDAYKLIEHCVHEKKNNRKIDFSSLPALRYNV